MVFGVGNSNKHNLSVCKMQNIYFRINNLEAICLQVDEETYHSLKDSDNFALNYLTSLANSGLICVKNIEKVERSINSILYTPVIHIEELEVSDEDVPGTSKKVSDCAWTDAQTKLLLDKYESYLCMVGPMKKFKTKKCMWTQISTDLRQILEIDKSPLQCENRYKTIIKRKKKAVDNNTQSGSSRMAIDYEDELNKISAADDSIQPEVLRGVDRCVLKNNQSAVPGPSGCPNKKRKVEKSVQDVLLDIHNKKEENRERRHKERLDALKELGNLLLGRSKEKENAP